ncbi:MAG: hypothetical protein JO336_12150, partial [Acidobacteriia bacterium]|nr:hypothetical protein [Terriglobia bacterium]
MTVPLSRRALLALPAATLLRAASPLFTFRESFWLNLHHFLYVLGRLRNKDSQYARSPAIADTADLSNKQQAGWETAVTAYSTSTSKEDLVFDRGLARFTKALSETADNAMPGTDTSVGDALRSAGPIYREIWWPRHSADNRHRIRELQDL